MSPSPALESVTLAPSDFGFLFDSCRRCYWLKVRAGFKRPSTPFPKIFGRLDALTKDYAFALRSEELAGGLRAGRIVCEERWVRSRPMLVPGHATGVVLAGKIDTGLAFDDGTFGIIDFKTAAPKLEHAAFYSRQLHSYAIATENPAEGALALNPISQMGLICIEPTSMVRLEGGVGYKGTPVFLEIERDDAAFTAYLSQVLFVLERSEPPEETPGCPFCRYLREGLLVQLVGSAG